MPWLAPVTMATEFQHASVSSCRFQNHANHYIRRRIHRTVVYVVRPNLRAHPLRHVALRLRRNHAILFRQQKPRWLRFPRRHGSLLLNAFHRDRPLHGFENRGLVR